MGSKRTTSRASKRASSGGTRSAPDTDRAAEAGAELDDRRAGVLSAVVEEFISTAQPVGSQRVARARKLGVSSATIRNDMAVLERDGYLTQPHTSAGRVPTDKGYRYFVDHLGSVGVLSPPHATRVSEFFSRAQSALEDMLDETSRLLARITEHTALVVGPAAESATVVSSQVVSIQPDVVLVVAVLSNGAIEKVTLRLDEELGQDDLARVERAVGDAVAGHVLGELAEPAPTGSAAADRVAVRLVDELAALAGPAGHEPVFVGGRSNIAAEAQDFTARETVARLLEMLEQQFLVVSLARSLIDQGLSVRIGSENERLELKECSIVVAPILVDDDLAGTVGVLGPTRMDYAQAMAAVSTVSLSLSRHLSA